MRSNTSSLTQNNKKWNRSKRNGRGTKGIEEEQKTSERSVNENKQT
jgi:hypothetical protein